MSREMELRHLELANRHIAEGQQRIADQKARIARLERRGHDTIASHELLEAFEETLELMMRHRDLILRELAGPAREMTMATSPDSISVGQCYLTTTQQVRKVVQVDGDWVTYVAREKKPTLGWERGQRYQTTLRKFGGEVTPCSCDWTASP